MVSHLHGASMNRFISIGTINHLHCISMNRFRLSWRRAPWDSRPIYFFNWTLAVIVLMEHRLWREDESVVYNSCWPSPEQPFSYLSPSALVTTSAVSDSRLRQLWRPRPRIPPGIGWPGYTPRHWVSFSSPPTTRRTTVEVFNPWEEDRPARSRLTGAFFKISLKYPRKKTCGSESEDIIKSESCGCRNIRRHAYMLKLTSNAE
jgi:hypothetical protein